MPKGSRAETRAEDSPARELMTIAKEDVGDVAALLGSDASDVGLAVPVRDTPPPADASPPMPSAAPAEAPRTHFSPAELALVTGNANEVMPQKSVRFGGGKPQKILVHSWQHTAAAQLHGWGAHEHHAGAPIQLTRDDYEKALEAASEPVTRLLDKDGKPTGDPLTKEAVAAMNGRQPVRSDYEPHRAALSPHAPKEG